MRFRSWSRWAEIGTLLVLAVSADAEESLDCGIALRKERSAIEQAIERRAFAEAADRARALNSRCPDEAAPPRLLARAYVAAGNLVAASLTLRDRLRRNPEDCETRAWLAWILITQADFEQARQTLDETAACPASEPERRRWSLLSALLARERRDRRASRDRLVQVGDRAALLPEDRALWRDLNRSARPGWSPPVRLAAELSGGGTSDALAGSPTDMPGDSVASALARARFSLRLRAPESVGLAPFMETNVRAHGIAADDARELSYVALDLRAGVEFSPGDMTSRLAYRYEELWLNLEGGPSFSTADRVELGISLSRLELNVGVGQRDFIDEDRSRSELDAAILRSTRISDAPVFLAFAARSYRARRAAYHQLGATLTGALAGLSLGKDTTAEIIAATAYDVYPSSGGTDGRLVFGTDRKRRDWVGKLSLSLWKRLSKLASVGVRYDFARRWSTADQRIRFYPYTEHRGSIELRIASSWNPWRRSADVTADHVPIPYEAAASPMDTGRIHEILRPDEDLAGGCPDVCVVP